MWKGNKKYMQDNILLYEKIIHYLRDKIDKKELQPGDRLPTEMELAEKFRVSRITSKRALEELREEGLIYRVRGKGSFVAEPKLPEILSDDASGSMDYSRVIVIVIPFSLSNGGVVDIIRGASGIASERGYILDIKYSRNDLEEERKLLLSLYKKGVGGIIFYPIADGRNLEVMNMLSMEGYPIVTIDRYFESLPISCIVSDNKKGEYEATKYLLERGHKNIAFITAAKIEDATSVRNRYFGYCMALKEYGVETRHEFVRNGDLYENEVGQVLADMLENGVTAICCVNDYVAVSVLRHLRGLGVEVPRQVSVIGFDNLDFCEMAYVPLTSMAQDLEQIGERAAKFVVECIENGQYEYRREIIPVRLVTRESCRSLRNLEKRRS